MHSSGQQRWALWVETSPSSGSPVAAQLLPAEQSHPEDKILGFASDIFLLLGRIGKVELLCSEQTDRCSGVQAPDAAVQKDAR